MIVDKVRVYGIDESFAGSKLPMAVDASKCTEDFTPTIASLGSSDPGSGHDQFLTGCIVQFNLTFSIKAWTEAERYHFFDFVSSQSTMHRITRFDIDKQCNQYVDRDVISLVQKIVDDYNVMPTTEGYLRVLYNVPVGFQLTARMTTNYRQLKTIYNQRKNHRLPEWRQFCEWIKTLPYMDEFLKEEEHE